MHNTVIYQTLEDRGNYQDIESHGPYICSLYDDYGKLKSGIKEPWLGEGYYFWDTRIDDAHWWGRYAYEQNMKGYVICQTFYDQHSPLLYDMVGSIDMFDDFMECAKIIKARNKVDRVSFCVVLEYMKQQEDFNYKAIRVLPYPKIKNQNQNIDVFFPGNKAYVKGIEKVQICFFDKTLLNQPFTIVEKKTFIANFTI